MLTVTNAVLLVVAGPYHAIHQQNELHTHCCTYVRATVSYEILLYSDENSGGIFGRLRTYILKVPILNITGLPVAQSVY
jgi:hypothetical protein